ncbi:tRNA pseudouridine(54/55) synthase Pus10 [Methanobrevibacter sp. TMH8]|uniref:tRNA pseudouridine(54/55) synthase Pus10 n=1 Tax=Methanobrevibacter sp. TMH8 TaxID=2848611 RepID=UPI001CCFE2BB|nr:tRNA pseudouridine(54/55) synthase Pus10 [Methanobrevibacter sp. TMH8]MBZ9570047.1 tRNA pseudouridine(54/55) synthase Pus10 [Methanobrevibacter sp. TMH8]
MNENILLKAKKLIELNNGNICNRCLGRKFSDIIESSEADGNEEKGKLIQNNLNFESVNFDKEVKCETCSNILFEIDKNIKNGNILERIKGKIDYLNLEFDTFLIGSKIPEKILNRDEWLNEALDLDVENIKKEINREIGKLIEKELNKEVDFDNPDIVIMVDLRKIMDENYSQEQSNQLENIKVRIQINPIFIEGRYKKLIRGIPQTKWPCRKCKGKGCDDCNGTGKMYKESVEELISEIVLKETRGYEAKFHGAGREDIDVRMLGTGRPFVLEIKEPKIRKLDLKQIQKEVNEHSKGKTEYIGLKFTERKRKAEIKVSSPDTFKVYRALVECEDNITEKELAKIKAQLENKIIDQQTPQRVAHRRADKVRKREVRELSTKLLSSNTFEMIVKTQGGLYIKELISSDDYRTKPNVSEILETNAICKELDVIEVG